MREEKWLVYGKKADFKSLGEQYSIDPVVARIIRNRGHETAEDFEDYLNGDETKLHHPYLFKDMEKAAEILWKKIDEKKKIRIIGDYDIDGVCSTYILVEGLRQFGADVSMDIPDRIKDGYGINENLIKRAYESGIDTIVTCDNGIAAIEQIAYAKELGMTVIVTDHHEIPYREKEENGEIVREYLRVEADATVDAKQPDCHYPFPLLCGAAVAYKLILTCGIKRGIYQDDPSFVLEDFIEFAAIATIGDVVDLYGENRILTKLGLKRVNKTKNLGLRALIKACELEEKEIVSYHIGFVIGPCLNASGRLETAKYAFGLLNAKTEQAASEKAEHLKRLNDERKDLTDKGVEQALIQAQQYEEDKFLVLFLPEVHESIAGIIAGRVRERFHKPTLVLTRAEEGVKGSGRSIEGCNMFEELTACAELLAKFGGHEMAAGLSLKEENIEPLRRMLNEKTKLTEEDLIPKIWIDVPMPLEYISENLISQLRVLEPFGKGNEKPVFADKNLSMIKMQVIGKNQDSLKFTLKTAKGALMTALLFRNADEFTEDLTERYGEEEVSALRMGLKNHIKMSVIYYPQINEFNGRRENQIIIQNYCFPDAE